MSALVGWLRRTLAWSNSRQAWFDRLAVAGLAAGAVALILLAPRLSLATQVLLWALLLTAAAFTSRLLGPVLLFDLVRIARRNRYYLARVLYVLFLLSMLSWVYFVYTANNDSGRVLRPNEAANFASSFFYMFMAVQFLIITLVTPAYVAGAIAEDKERRTLEFLLATDLLNREIVLSKLVSRLLNLLMLVLTGLPVLAGLQFLGGVEPLLVIAGFTATLLTVAGLAGLSILASVLSRRARDAIVLTYLMAAAYLALSGLSWFLIVPTGWATFPSTTTWTSPVTVRDLVGWFNAGNIGSAMWWLLDDVNGGRRLDEALAYYLRNYALVQGAVALLAPLWAVLRLRAIALKETSEPARRKRGVFRLGRRRRLGSHPMLWKEVFAERGPRLPWVGKVVVVLLVLVSFAPAVVIGYLFLEGTIDSPLRFFGSRPDLWDALGENTQLWVVRVAGTGVACLLLMAVAVRASSCVSIERDRQTLDGLLTTPLDSDAILAAKWLGAVLSVRRGWLWLGALWGIGVATGGMHPAALLLSVVTWFVYAAFLAGLGAWFSTTSRTTLRATTWTLVCAVGAALGHWLVWLCCVPVLMFQTGPIPGILTWVLRYQFALTPPVNLGFHASFRPGDFGDGAPEEWWKWVGFSVMATATWAVLAAVLWVQTSRRFRELTGRAAFGPERPVRPRPRAAPVPAANGVPAQAEASAGEEVDGIKGPQLP